MRGLSWFAARIDAVFLGQQGHLFPWAPVLLALGIGGYFAMQREPTGVMFALVALGGAAGAVAALRRPATWTTTWSGSMKAIGWAVTLVAAGFCLAGLRAHTKSGPVLGWRYYGPVEGRVVGMDRSASDALRVTLDRVTLDRLPPDRVPDRVRISLHGDLPERLMPGQRIMTTAHLLPPQGPVEPGGFDFRRHAWFQALGAVGYTRTPALIAAPAHAGGLGLRILTMRMAMSARVQAVLPGDTGGFAAAVTTGDRSAMSKASVEALRASNLAHLLAISGLHMGLLAGFVFAALRVGFASVPSVALRLPVKKLAAIGALCAATVYLALSGGSVATERAFVMVAVVLGAVLVDRRAFSLRAVAMAALIVLVLRPEALLGPGFQMSFAATTALIAVFGWIRDARITFGPDWLKPVQGVVISSAVAGAATAPVAAAHFNALAQYGLPANLLSVPLMGVLVMPAAVLAACLAPIGLEAIGLYLMGLGLKWILGVANYVAAIEGARRYVVRPDGLVLPILSLGLLWLILWQGRARWIGLVPVVAAMILWTQSPRPAVLIADTGGLVGVMTDEGRALSKPRGGGFIARNWLENDGDDAAQDQAAMRWPGEAKSRVRRIAIEGSEVVHVLGKRGAGEISRCSPNQVLVSSVPLSLPGGCRILDPKSLRRSGSVAISTKGSVTTAREVSGRRLWHMAIETRSGKRPGRGKTRHDKLSVPRKLISREVARKAAGSKPPKP